MEWVEVFIVMALSHVVGDFLFQTEWQATNKFGGLRSGRPEARRALFKHVFTYMLAFVPALIWLGGEIGAAVAWIIALVAIPHLVQDDGFLLTEYTRRVKQAFSAPGDLVFILVDQSLHLVALFFVALLAAGAA